MPGKERAAATAPDLSAHNIGAMKFASSGFAVLRTPTYPLSDFLALASDLEAHEFSAAGDDLDQAYRRDRAKLRQRLAEIIQRPEFREAVFLASPSLEERISVWTERPDSDEGQRIERALYKYFVRMSGRPTPFGTFAGCSHCQIDQATNLQAPEPAQCKRRSRLDMNYVSELVLSIEKDSRFKQALRYYPNGSLYPAAGRTRYIEYRMEENHRVHHLVAVDKSEYLDLVLARARAGCTPRDLATAIVDFDQEIDSGEALAFVSELIDSQLLVSELTLNVTGPDIIDRLAEKLAELPDGQEYAATLRRGRAALEEIDASGMAVQPQKYRDLASILEPLPAKIDLKTLVQVDLFKPTPDATLGSKVVKEILRGVELLHKLAPSVQHPGLARFREEFLNRYGDREVPLVEALDEEIGIGFMKSSAPSADDSPLLANLALSPPTAEEKVLKDPRMPFLLRILNRALSSRVQEIELSKDEIEAMSVTNRKPLPDGFAAIACLLSGGGTDPEGEDFRVFLYAAAGPSGVGLLGRFCHLDETIETAVKRHVRMEEALRPEAVFAEVVHLPEGRIGNVLFRPVLREHEIPILGRSTLPAENQIPLTDLMVSIRGEAIALRSARLGREIVPRLSSAHNYEGRNIGIYMFLCALQTQSICPSCRWDWGLLGDAPFLPRIVHGRFVLSRASWRLNRRELDIWGKRGGVEGYDRIQQWRRENRVPRYLEFADGDNRLPLDLDNALSVDVLSDLAGKYQNLILEEMLPGPTELVAKGPQGLFVHELVVPAMRTAEDPPQARSEREAADRVDGRPRRGAESGENGRLRVPGSDWLYAKLYCGQSDADFLLRELVAPLVSRAKAEHWIDGWFFIRYSDPDWHLRIRFRGAPDALISRLLPSLHEFALPALQDGRLHKLVLDSYEREVDRYGGPEGIACAEEIFHADSEAVLAVVRMLVGDAGSAERWRLALLGLDMLMEDFGLELPERLVLMRQAAESFGREFGAEKHLKQIGKKFRGESDSLLGLLARQHLDNDVLSSGMKAFQDRRSRAQKAIADLRTAEAAGRLTTPWAPLVGSFAHLHANRLLRSAARAQEAVLYNFLAKLYLSIQTRQKQT